MDLLIGGFEHLILKGGVYVSVYDMLSFCCMFKLRIQYSFTTFNVPYIPTTIAYEVAVELYSPKSISKLP